MTENFKSQDTRRRTWECKRSLFWEPGRNSAAENLFFISSGVHAHEPKKGPNLVNLPCILLGLHEKERQEVNNNAEETPVLQEPKANSAVETPILQETKINSAAETQGLQEPSATSGNHLCCLFRSKFHGSWNMVTRKGPGSGHPSNSCVSATAMGTYKICELFSVPRPLSIAGGSA